MRRPVFESRETRVRARVDKWRGGRSRDGKWRGRDSLEIFGVACDARTADFRCTGFVDEYSAVLFMRLSRLMLNVRELSGGVVLRSSGCL